MSSIEISLAETIYDDIWLQIFYWLPLSSLLSVMLTSKRFYALADDNSVWHNLVSQWETEIRRNRIKYYLNFRNIVLNLLFYQNGECF